VIKTIDCHSHDSLHRAPYSKYIKKKKEKEEEEEKYKNSNKKKTRLTLFRLLLLSLPCGFVSSPFFCFVVFPSPLFFVPCVSPSTKFHSPEEATAIQPKKEKEKDKTNADSAIELFFFFLFRCLCRGGNNKKVLGQHVVCCYPYM
jgi:hypothetical protein